MRLSLVALFLAVLLAGLPPVSTRAQTVRRGGKKTAPQGAVKICRGVSIPDGYTIVAETTSPACPDGAYVIKRETASASGSRGVPAAQQPAPPVVRRRRVAGGTTFPAGGSATQESR